jgi:UDP:flavonoid glycosyltransferase YjiC (YdhE family)
VVPKPADWGDWRHVTGYWFLDDDGSWKPPAPLLQFLKGGPPPVVISFGSTRTHDPEALAGTAIAALTSSGRRGILVTGGGGIQAETLPPTVAQVPAVPFDWLFPRSAAAVHHGGAGTTAAGLRAGVPTVVTPFFNEQRFWARRVHTLGAGPAPLRWRGLTPAKLNDAIEEAITSQSIRDRAAGVGALIRGENGPQRAVEVFEHYVQTWAPAR